MEELKIYSVSDEYIEYLRKEEPNVYSNKIDSRTHTRKYIGIVLKLGKYDYVHCIVRIVGFQQIFVTLKQHFRASWLNCYQHLK